MIWILAILLAVSMIIFLIVSFVLYHKKVSKRRKNIRRIEHYWKVHGIVGATRIGAAKGAIKQDLGHMELGHRSSELNLNSSEYERYESKVKGGLRKMCGPRTFPLSVPLSLGHTDDIIYEHVGHDSRYAGHERDGDTQLGQSDGQAVEGGYISSSIDPVHSELSRDIVAESTKSDRLDDEYGKHHLPNVQSTSPILRTSPQDLTKLYESASLSDQKTKFRQQFSIYQNNIGELLMSNNIGFNDTNEPTHDSQWYDRENIQKFAVEKSLKLKKNSGIIPMSRKQKRKHSLTLERAIEMSAIGAYEETGLKVDQSVINDNNTRTSCRGFSREDIHRDKTKLKHHESEINVDYDEDGYLRYPEFLTFSDVVNRLHEGKHSPERNRNRKLSYNENKMAVDVQSNVHPSDCNSFNDESPYVARHPLPTISGAVSMFKTYDG